MFNDIDLVTYDFKKRLVGRRLQDVGSDTLHIVSRSSSLVLLSKSRLVDAAAVFNPQGDGAAIVL